jgi:hypothetical protein
MQHNTTTTTRPYEIVTKKLKKSLEIRKSKIRGMYTKIHECSTLIRLRFRILEKKFPTPGTWSKFEPESRLPQVLFLFSNFRGCGCERFSACGESIWALVSSCVWGLWGGGWVAVKRVCVCVMTRCPVSSF